MNVTPCWNYGAGAPMHPYAMQREQQRVVFVRQGVAA
jgi:hypothetical protein